MCECRNLKCALNTLKLNLVSIYCENYRSLTVFCMSRVAPVLSGSNSSTNSLLAIKHNKLYEKKKSLEKCHREQIKNSNILDTRARATTFKINVTKALLCAD